MPECAVCHTGKAQQVIAVLDIFGKRRRVYVCALCAVAYHHGWRMKR